MRGRYYKYAVTVLVALIATPLLAQYTVYDAPPPKWSLYGNAGFDFAHNSLGSQNAGTTGSNTDQLFGGTVDATLNGFISRPEFLMFGASVNDLQNASSNSGNSGNINLPGFDSRNNALGWTAFANFLSGRGMPVYVHYIKTDAGLSSSLFRTNQGTSEFGVDWRGKLPHLPNLDFEYRDSSTDVALPTSLLDNTTSQRIILVNAHDSFLGWKWNGNYSHIGQDLESVGVTPLPQTQNTTATNEDFNIRRGFMDNLFTFSAGERLTIQNTDGSLGSNDYKLFGYNTSLWFLPSNKWDAGVTFSHDQYTSHEFAPATPGTPITTIFLPSNTITAITGTTNYRPVSYLTLTGGVTYNDTFVPSEAEQLEKTLTPMFGAALNRNWHTIDLTAHGMVGYRLTTSNLGQASNGVIDNFGISASRGSLQRLRYTGKVEYNHDILPQVLGSYNNSLRAGVLAETLRWGDWRLTAGADYTKYDTLTIGGLFNNKTVGFNLGASTIKYGLRGFYNHFTGDGAIFPVSLTMNTYLIDLPLQSLVSSPLLNRTGNNIGLSGFFNWRRWVINGSFTRENDLLSATEQKYNIVDITVRYTLGKFTLDAGYGRNVLNTGLPPLVSGTTFNRFRFRITRSFTIF